LLNDLQAEFGIAPATEESEKVRCSSAAFPKLFRNRNTGSFCYNVTPFPENCCSTLFTTGYKRLTEGGHQASGFWLLEGEAFLDVRGCEALGFWMEWKLLKGEFLKGGLLKGKEFLKGNC
jgi:hypothetical protein